MSSAEYSKKTKPRRDIYYRKAKEVGFRARSAFKLLQVDQEFDIFSNVNCAVDLCAAPGSWSQVLGKKLCSNIEDKKSKPIIVAVDIQEMAPIDDIKTMVGDITDDKTAEEILSIFNGAKADLVVSDGAPDVTGLHEIDEFLQAQLLLSALSIASKILAIGGTFVAKVFKGKELDLLYSQARLFFKEVSIFKPDSSRKSSAEHFLVCRRYFAPPNCSIHSLKHTLLVSERRNPNRHTESGNSQELSQGIDQASAEGHMQPLDRFVLNGDLSIFD